MNQLVGLLGIEHWKPFAAALLLPPVPLLIVALVGAALLFARRAWGWVPMAAALVMLWLGSTIAMGEWLERALLPVPPALTAQRVEALRRDAKTRSATAVVVLGGGMEPLAPEYGVSSLNDYSLQRLRYGMWLGRETGAPVAFSGGTGWGSGSLTSEADVAARIAAQDFGRPLRWVEGASHDTRGNAAHVVPLLRRAGVTHVLLVTHGWHMPRARRDFEEVAAPAGVRIEPAPMGLARHDVRPALDWFPSERGFARVRHVLREAIGRAAGA